MKETGLLLLCSGILLATRPVYVVGQAAMIAAAAQVVSAGTSLIGTSVGAMLNDGYRVTCVISVENWTRFPLVYPDTRIHGGRLSKPPRAILPSSREAMVARKTGLTATGSYGTVSWLIRGLNRRVYVMWDAPFSFDFHENELSVGLSKPGHIDHPSGRTAYDLMYYGGSRDADWMEFRRRVFWRSLSPVIYRDDRIEIVGTMSNTHDVEVDITVRPKRHEDLAAPIRMRMNQN